MNHYHITHPNRTNISLSFDPGFQRIIETISIREKWPNQQTLLSYAFTHYEEAVKKGRIKIRLPKKILRWEYNQKKEYPTPTTIEGFNKISNETHTPLNKLFNLREGEEKRSENIEFIVDRETKERIISLQQKIDPQKALNPDHSQKEENITWTVIGYSLMFKYLKSYHGKDMEW